MTHNGKVKRPHCVYCRLHTVHPDWQPFCSERCRVLDLSHWLDGDYRVPVSEPDEVPGEEIETSGIPDD